MAKKTAPSSPIASPAVHTAGRPKLRVLGTEVTQLQSICRRAEEDLGFDIVFETLDFQRAQRKAATEPGSFDVYDQCFHNLDIVWFWRAIQPLDLDRITRWDEVSDLTKTGRLTPSARIGWGDAPVSRLYAQPNGSLGSIPTGHISMLPTVHNLDSFAYIAPAVGVQKAPPLSWAALFEPNARGLVGIVDEPAIGIFDLALALQASGRISFADMGNMSTGEIDQLIDIALVHKRTGHFATFWKTAEEAASLMAAGQMAIGSMWSLGISALRSRGVAVVEAAPIEGYRAWHGGLCLSRCLSGRMLDVAYEYLNWWLDGWAGAIMARQGFYMSAPQRIRRYLSPEEWAYWYEGQPAAVDLCGPDGRRTILAGERRSGGSYWQRAGSIAVWNSTMDEHNYLTRRWADLVRC